HSQPGAMRSRLVIQTAVQHPAVVAALVESDRALLFKDGDLGAGQPLLQTERRGKSHDSAPYDHDAHTHHSRLRGVTLGFHGSFSAESDSRTGTRVPREVIRRIRAAAFRTARGSCLAGAHGEASARKDRCKP